MSIATHKSLKSLLLNPDYNLTLFWVLKRLPEDSAADDWAAQKHTTDDNQINFVLTGMNSHDALGGRWSPAKSPALAVLEAAACSLAGTSRLDHQERVQVGAH